MAPDLNSLPPSRSPSSSSAPQTVRITTSSQEQFRPQNQTPSPSTRSPSMSLAAAATINAGIQNEDSRRSSGSSNRIRGASIPNLTSPRRRSSVMMNLNINDPAMASPGELQHDNFDSRAPWATADPHHQRAPSIGELHQQLETEQEAQVNRLLNMIRQQQAQIQQMQSAQISSMGASNNATSTAIVDDSTPPTPSSTMPSASLMNSAGTAALVYPRPRSPLPRTGSYDLSRQSSRRSRRSSHIASPSLRPLSIIGQPYNEPGEPLLGAGGGENIRGSREEVSFYQTETANLTRENQMLKMRLRELERQLQETQRATNPPSGLHTQEVAATPATEQKGD